MSLSFLWGARGYYYYTWLYLWIDPSIVSLALCTFDIIFANWICCSLILERSKRNSFQIYWRKCWGLYTYSTFYNLMASENLIHKLCHVTHKQLAISGIIEPRVILQFIQPWQFCRSSGEQIYGMWLLTRLRICHCHLLAVET